MYKLLKERIVQMARRNIEIADQVLKSNLGLNDPLIRAVANFTGRPPEYELRSLFQNAVDFTVAKTVAEQGETIIFDSRQALALRPAMQRFTDRPFWRIPFPATILQFTVPIREQDFFHLEPVRLQRKDDPVWAVLLSEYENTRNAIAFFESSEMQRVKWIGDDPTSMNDLIDPNDTPSAEAWHNKKQLQLLAMACAMYLSCENIEIKRNEDYSRADRRRSEKSGEPLPVYYIAQETTRVVKYHYAKAEEQTEDDEDEQRHGTPHGHRYDVNPFFRQLQDGRIIIVRKHERGLAHPPESKRTKTKKVPYTPDDPRLRETP